MRNKQILLLALRTIKIKIENYRILNKKRNKKIANKANKMSTEAKKSRWYNNTHCNKINDI